MWPLPSNPISPDEPLNSDALAVIGAVTFALFALSGGGNGGIIRRREDEIVPALSLKGLIGAFSTTQRFVFSLNASIGSALAAVLASAFFAFCLLPRGIASAPIHPSQVCIAQHVTADFLKASPRLVLHFFYVSDRSIFYWAVLAPLLTYITTALLQWRLGFVMTLLSVMVAVPLSALATVTLASDTNFCYFGVDAALLAFCAVLFVANPVIHFHSQSARAERYFADRVECRYVAAGLAFFVLSLLPAKHFTSIACGGTLAGLLVAVPHVDKNEIRQILTVPTVGRRFIASVALFVGLILLPFSLMHIPTFSMVRQLLLDNPPNSFATVLRRLDVLFRPSNSVLGITFLDFPSPFPQFLAKLTIVVIPLALFSHYRGVTILAAFCSIALLFFTAITPFWVCPGPGAVLVGISVWGLLR